jgi:serine/threonine protein kinase
MLSASNKRSSSVTPFFKEDVVFELLRQVFVGKAFTLSTQICKSLMSKATQITKTFIGSVELHGLNIVHRDIKVALFYSEGYA